MSNTYILDPDAKPTWKSVTISSATEATINDDHSVVANSTDGYRTVTAVHLDNLSYSVTVKTNDMQFADNANFQRGQSGTLVLNCIIRDVGQAVGSTKKRATAAQCMCLGSRKTWGGQGNSEIEISFICYNSSGSDPIAWSSY